LPSVTLLARVYHSSQLAQADRNLNSLLKGLKVETRVLGADSFGLVRISISGEDENVAVRYLADNIGLGPPRLEEIMKYSTFKGYVKDPSRSRNELWVDIGVSSPSHVKAAVPLGRLQAQLCDGRKIALGKIAELFGFCENLPLHIRVTGVEPEKGYIEAELSEKQQDQFAGWTRSLLDRLLILGASYGEVDSAIRRAEFIRDVAKVEPLGMFEQAVLCKLGTDAAGLIPKMGKNLRRAVFSVFSPRKILAMFGYDSALFAS
jgi:hypothetical protein